MAELIAKGFGKPTARVERLKKVMVDTVPVVESERAKLVTQVYRETENMSAIMRRAKVMEKLLAEMPIVIRDDELIVGAPTVNPRASDVGIEFSYDWLEPEFETMATRANDPYIIDEKTKAELRDCFGYWEGKTIYDYATSLMSQECKDCQDHNVFNAGNYLYAGIGHTVVNYEKIIKRGFRGVIEEAALALEALKAKEVGSNCDPEFVKKEQFYKAVIITYNACINHAHRYADKAEELARAESNPTRRAELELIAKNCRHAPEYGARNFYEACQTFWFVHFLIHFESNGHSYSPGPFDRFMIQFYESDPNIKPEFAQELIDCLFVKFNDTTKIRDDISAQAFAGYQHFEHVALGGTDSYGNDTTNDLSYMCLEALAHVGMPSPSLGTRIGNQTPEEYIYRVCETIRLGHGMPNVFNDEVIIPSLVNLGIPLEEARTYTPHGCVEPVIPGKTDGWTDSASFNVAKVVEITLNNGMCDGVQLGPVTGDITTFTCIEDFFTAFQKQMEYFVYRMIEADNCIDIAHADKCPLPYLAGIIDGCIDNGKATQNGGAIYNFSGPQAFGVVDAGDSLYAIQKNVFEDKKLTLTELKDALDHNFGYPDGGGCPAESGGSDQIEARIYEAVKAILSGSGSVDLSSTGNVAGKIAEGCSNPRYEEIRRLLDNTPAYGNDLDEVDSFAVRCARIYCEQVQLYTNPRGGQYHAGIYPVSANVLYGKDVAAMPTGRLARTPLSDGVSPRAGKDTHGPTASANSVSKLDHSIASNGTLYNQKFMPAALAGDEGLVKFAALIRNYFDRKGWHIQFNVVDRDTLLDAQKHPEDHKDLVVRVAGYSAYFTRLAKEVQDNIISRSELSF